MLLASCACREGTQGFCPQCGRWHGAAPSRAEAPAASVEARALLPVAAGVGAACLVLVGATTLAIGLRYAAVFAAAKQAPGGGFLSAWLWMIVSVTLGLAVKTTVAAGIGRMSNRPVAWGSLLSTLGLQACGLLLLLAVTRVLPPGLWYGCHRVVGALAIAGLVVAVRTEMKVEWTAAMFTSLLGLAASRAVACVPHVPMSPLDWPGF